MRRSFQACLVVVGNSNQQVRVPVTREEYEKAFKSFDRITGGSERIWHVGKDVNGNGFLIGFSTDTLGIFFDTEPMVREGLIDFIVTHKNGGVVRIRLEEAYYGEVFGRMQEPTNAFVIQNWGVAHTDASGNRFRIMAGIEVTSAVGVPVSTSHEELLSR